MFCNSIDFCVCVPSFEISLPFYVFVYLCYFLLFQCSPFSGVADEELCVDLAQGGDNAPSV